MITDIQIDPNNAHVLLTLAKAKKQLRVDASFMEEDDLIQDYIDAAVTAAENYIGGHLQEKTMVISMDSFQNALGVSAFPVQVISSVEYFAPGEATVTVLATSKYKLTTLNQKVFNVILKEDLPEVDDRSDAVVYKIKVGYPVAGKVPADIVKALLLHISESYDVRENRKEINLTAFNSLLRPYKLF